MLSDQDLILSLSRILAGELQQTSSFVLKKSTGAKNSIYVHALPSAYRSNDEQDIFFARFKTSGKIQYISFSAIHRKLFEAESIEVKQICSQPIYVRIDFSDFEKLLEDFDLAHKILYPIFANLFSLSEFGCCSRYVECSDAKKCIHPDPVYGTACQYRRNLDSGRIFYGSNRNI